MKMKNYIKGKKEKFRGIRLSKLIADGVEFMIMKRKTVLAVISLLLIVPISISMFSNRGMKEITLNDSEVAELADMPISAALSTKSVITIPAGMAKSNPFVPYREVSSARTSKANDVPAFSLVEPPEDVNENSDAARVMDTIVSGILYDKYSPSAILNIEGTDYLVKKGDVVNNYKVLNILQDSVTVKLGANVYKAGIGEILTEGSVNKSTVSNLGNKFGGAR